MKNDLFKEKYEDIKKALYIIDMNNGFVILDQWLIKNIRK